MSASLPVRRVFSDYRPSDTALEFHHVAERFRMLCWGIKSGKSRAGAAEFIRATLSKPNSLNWVVAPTNRHLDASLAEIMKVLAGMNLKFVRMRGHKRQIIFPNGAVSQLQSAELPDNLRGPGIDGCLWVDEGSFMTQEAWMILRGRIIAHEAEVLVTTTPKGRDWFYEELRLGGMPADAPYGEFCKGNRWISHRPTWDFPWVTAAEIEDARQSMSTGQFNQEFGAMFMATASQVFSGIENALSLERLPEFFKGDTILGLDLGKNQDYTAVVVMTGAGRVLHIDRWQRVDWNVTKERIRNLAKKWKAVVVMDLSNVGSTIYDDLRGEDFELHGVTMHSPDVKNDLIEALQMAFEQTTIQLVSPKSEWATSIEDALIAELFSYEAKLTPGGRISYGAPKGLHDDLVIALALAQWGRARGMVSAGHASQVILTRQEMAELARQPTEEADMRAMGRKFSRFTRPPRADGGRGQPRSMFGGGSRNGIWSDR